MMPNQAIGLLVSYKIEVSWILINSWTPLKIG